MKQLLIGIIFGLVLSGCCMAKEFIKSSPLTIVLTERNFVNTSTVTTEEGTYRLFMIESTDGKGGVGITAVKIK